MLSQNLAFLRDLTTVNTAPRLLLLLSLLLLNALSLTRISLYILRYSTKWSDLSDARLLLFFSFPFSFVPIFVLSKAALTQREQYHEPRSLGSSSSSTAVSDHRRSSRSSDAASKFRLPNPACPSFVQSSSSSNSNTAPCNQSTAQTHSHTLALSRPDRN